MLKIEKDIGFDGISALVHEGYRNVLVCGPRKLFKPYLDRGGPNWPITRFFLYNSETV